MLRKTISLLTLALLLLIQNNAICQEIKNDTSDYKQTSEIGPININGIVTSISTDRFKLYPTHNKFNFLKLDTMSGRIKGIQWNIDDDKRFEYSVSYTNLVMDYPMEEWVNGRFEIYQTDNIYNYLLLDKIDGRVWQFQCGPNVSSWIERIY